MRRHVFTEDDMYRGAKMLCIGGYYAFAKVGRVYAVLENTGGVYSITDDDGAQSWTLNELNNPTPHITLFPMDRLTGQERFIFELSGRLPE